MMDLAFLEGTLTDSLAPLQRPISDHSILQALEHQDFDVGADHPKVWVNCDGMRLQEKPVSTSVSQITAQTDSSQLQAPVSSESMKPPPRPRKRKAATLRESDWEPHKARIIELHIRDNRPLAEVRLVMEKESGFVAEIRQYRARITQWKLDKNVKTDEMRCIIRKRQKRKLIEVDKGELLFRVRGHPVQSQKIERWMKRHDVPESMLFATSPAPSTPSAVSCATMSERGSPAPSPRYPVETIESQPSRHSHHLIEPELPGDTMWQFAERYNLLHQARIESLPAPPGSQMMTRDPAAKLRALLWTHFEQAGPATARDQIARTFYTFLTKPLSNSDRGFVLSPMEAGPSGFLLTIRRVLIPISETRIAEAIRVHVFAVQDIFNLPQNPAHTPWTWIIAMCASLEKGRLKSSDIRHPNIRHTGLPFY